MRNNYWKKFINWIKKQLLCLIPKFLSKTCRKTDRLNTCQTIRFISSDNNNSSITNNWSLFTLFNEFFSISFNVRWVIVSFNRPRPSYFLKVRFVFGFLMVVRLWDLYSIRLAHFHISEIRFSLFLIHWDASLHSFLYCCSVIKKISI